MTNLASEFKTVIKKKTLVKNASIKYIAGKTRFFLFQVLCIEFICMNFIYKFFVS